MEFFPVSITEKSKREICIVNLTILCYLFRTALPFFKYPFILFYIYLIAYSLLNHKNQIIISLKAFVRNYYLLFILALLLVVSFLLSNKLYLIIFKDVLNMIIMFSLFFLARMAVEGENEFRFYFSNLIFLIVLFAFIITVVGLLFFFDIVTYKDFLYNNSISELPATDSSEADYNIALLPVFFGLFSILFLLPKIKSRLLKVSLNILLIILSVQIFLSGSRRGLILFLLILLLLGSLWSYTTFKRDSRLSSFAKESGLFLVLFCFLSFSTYLFFNRLPYNSKNKFLEFIGSKNFQITKDKITKKVLRYSSIIDKSSNYRKLNKALWSLVFIPYDPDSGWGSRIHKTEFPLKGKNVEIVPGGVKGYLMDNTCNASYYKESNTSESYTLLLNMTANRGDSIKASVYCFVSDSFDASPVVLSVGAETITNKKVSGIVTDSYNLEEKGIWQKLEIEFECSEGEISVYLSFMKNGVKDFRKLNGYVIFACPQYKIIQKEHNISSVYVTQKKNNMYPKYCSAEFSFFQLSFLSPSYAIGYDSDPLRNYISKLFSEDTTYHPYKSQIIINSTSNPFFNDRILRWEFGLKIFSLEYTWKQKIFGGGFNFLSWYGYYFMKDKTIDDWPHNPFLSVLLYSGVFGLLIYFFLLYKVFLYYFKYLREYPLLFIFFITAFFFSFFSAGSPFDPPIMGFFVILPFFVHSIHKKDNQKDKEIKSVL